MVGEVNLSDSAAITRYSGADQLHLAFDFGLLYAPWDAGAWRDVVVAVLAAVGPSAAWPTWVLGNHDQPRQRTRYRSQQRARAAAVALLTLPGTPFLYQGEELGLADADVPPERVVDPGGRDGTRAPIPWDGGPLHGWAAEPWLPWPPEADARNVAAQRADPGSILHLYRRLLAARRASPALTLGTLAFVDAPDGVLAWTRTAGGDRRAVAVNFTDHRQAVAVEGGWEVELASTRDAAEPGMLAPSQAVLLRPR